MIDTIRQVNTPEGVALELRVAGFHVRGAAYLVDFTISTAVISVVTLLLAVLGAFGVGMALIIGFLINWFYPVYFEVRRQGATPGKRMYNLCVVNSNGTPVTWGASLLRNLLRFADLLPAAYLSGIVVMMCDQGSRRLGDLAADTLVVYRDELDRIPELDEVAPVIPPVSLQQHEQRAVIEFAERVQGEAWSEKRTQELADILEDLTRESGSAGAARLRGIATHLVKGR